MSPYVGKCTLEELQIITNVLYDGGGPIEWSYPPIGEISKFYIREGVVSARVCSRDEYERKRDSFCDSAKGCDKEIPDYKQFMEVFFCAGVNPLSDVKKYLSRVMKSRSSLGGSKPLWLGYDTCALRRAFYSNIAYYLKETRLERSVGHVLAKGVSDEVMDGFDQKYRSQQLKHLEEAFPEAKNFLNQATLDARLHRIAFADMKKMRQRDMYHLTDSKMGDRMIIEGYEQFEQDRNAEVILFSADRNFIEMAGQCSFKSLYVEYNMRTVRKHLDEEPLPLDVLNAIFYYGTMVFGLTRLKGVTLQSIWRGKTGDDWNRGVIRVEAKGNIAGPFRKMHKVLKGLE